MEPVQQTIETIKRDLVSAIQVGNDVEFLRLNKLVSQYTRDIQLAEAKRQQIEAETVAVNRTALEVKIRKAIKDLIPSDELLKVGAKGFVFSVDHNEDAAGHIDTNGEVKVIGGCRLIVPVVKIRTRGPNKPKVE